MFEDKSSQSNTKSTERDINLLPENLRKKEQTYRAAGDTHENIKYSQAASGGTNLTSESDLSGWERVKQALVGALSFGRKKTPLAPRQVISPASPLQRLYAQDIKQQASVGSRDAKITPQTIPQPVSTIKPTVANEILKPHIVSKDLPKERPLSVLEKIDQQLQKGIHFADKTNESDDQFGVNLIPEDMISEVNEKKILHNLLWSFFISLFIVGMGYVVIEFLQLKEAKEIQKLKQEIEIYEDEFISKSDDLKALIKYQQTYDNINILLDSHLYWNKLFDFLETNVADNVHFLNVTADKNGLVSMAIVAKDYESLANQYEIFKSAEGVLEVDMTQAALSGGYAGEGSVLLQSDSTNNSMQNTSTPAIIDPRKLMLNAYSAMTVSSQVRLQLDSNMFYRK
jgi:hypothetical protein